MENTEMKDRIAHIIRAKNLTAAEFALRLGIQPSNVSHLLAGRNNPSLEFVKRLKETFPEYNLDWIVLGRGPMTVSEPVSGASVIEASAEYAKNNRALEIEAMEGTLFSPEASTETRTEMPHPTPSLHNVTQIIMVYADHSFEILSHR